LLRAISDMGKRRERPFSQTRPKVKGAINADGKGARNNETK